MTDLTKPDEVVENDPNNAPKLHRDFYKGLGWAYGKACSLADDGLDIRKIEVPELIAEANDLFSRCEEKDHQISVDGSLPQSADHQVWAREFSETAQYLGYPEMDEEWLAVWFANVLCAGRDAEGRAKDAEIERLRSALEFYADPKTWTPNGHPQIDSDTKPIVRDGGKVAREALKGGE